MEWLGDYLQFCLDHGFGGIVLLLIGGFIALAVGAMVLAGISKAAQAFGRGWSGAD